jgi:hypothetical protein
MKLEQSAARRTGWGHFKVPKWGQVRVPFPQAMALSGHQAGGSQSLRICVAHRPSKTQPIKLEIRGGPRVAERRRAVG